MITALDTPSEVKSWTGNFEMLKSFSGAGQPAIWALRSNAIAAFESLGFPTTKHEEWKYTSLRSLYTANYAPAFRASALPAAADFQALRASLLPDGLAGSLIVLVNGHFDAALSSILPSNVQVISLQAALAAENPVAMRHYGQVAEVAGHAMVALNTAIATDGAFVHISKDTQADAPITVLHLGTGDNVVANSRSLIVADAHSEAQIVELWATPEGDAWQSGAYWENHVSEIVVGVGANLELISLQNDLHAQFSLSSFCQVHQAKDSTFRSTVMSSKGKILRNDLQVLHQGSNCNTYMNGLTLLAGNTHVDNHTLVDHALPHCYSNETYKSVLDGHSTSVFNGKVMVRPDAQKTNAFQSNKTLLLSDNATVNTKPQLEIFADDVKCSHGATTGRIDETSLFYMRSRGLSEAKARALLTYAFAAEVVEQISIAELRTHLENFLLQRLSIEN